MEISLPPKLAEFVEEQVHAGHYSSASEIISEAVRDFRARKQEHFETAEFDRLIDEGKASPKRELTSEAWEEISQKMRVP